MNLFHVIMCDAHVPNWQSLGLWKNKGLSNTTNNSAAWHCSRVQKCDKGVLWSPSERASPSHKLKANCNVSLGCQPRLPLTLCIISPWGEFYLNSGQTHSFFSPKIWQDHSRGAMSAGWIILPSMEFLASPMTTALRSMLSNKRFSSLLSPHNNCLTHVETGLPPAKKLPVGLSF